MQAIHTVYSQKSTGHYAPAMEHGGLLYISGQLSLNPATGQRPEGGAAAETRQALDNMETVLQAAGIDRTHVLHCRVYTPDVALWDTINAEYAAFFGAHKPARTVVPTAPLHHGCLVEIDAVAAMQK